VLGETTVKTHVTRLFQKLDLHDRAQAVVHARVTGLVISSEAARRSRASPASRRDGSSG